MPSKRDNIIVYGTAAAITSGLFTVFCLVVAGLLAFKAGDYQAAGAMGGFAALSILVCVVAIDSLVRQSWRDEAEFDDSDPQ